MLKQQDSKRIQSAQRKSQRKSHEANITDATDIVIEDEGTVSEVN